MGQKSGYSLTECLQLKAPLQLCQVVSQAAVSSGGLISGKSMSKLIWKAQSLATEASPQGWPQDGAAASPRKHDTGKNKRDDRQSIYELILKMMHIISAMFCSLEASWVVQFSSKAILLKDTKSGCRSHRDQNIGKQPVSHNLKTCRARQNDEWNEWVGLVMGRWFGWRGWAGGFSRTITSWKEPARR